MAPAILNIYLAAVFLPSRHSLDVTDRVFVRYGLDGTVFNLHRLQERTKTNVDVIFDLQYADDTAFPSHTATGLQHTIAAMTEMYRSGHQCP